MNSHEKWYGDIGIDTPYERSLIKYRPNLIYPKKESSYPMNRESIIKISRAQDFMISKAILDYRSLIERLESLLQVLEERQDRDVFSLYISSLHTSDLEKVFEIESQESGYKGNLDYELYTMLYLMKESVSFQSEFLDEYFRTQITSETEDEQVIEAEGISINEWIKTEYDLYQMYEQLTHGEETEGNIQADIDLLESKKRMLDVFHTSLGDISYVHRNRFLMFKEIIDESEYLIHNPELLIDGNMKVFLHQVGNMQNKKDAKTHLILSFKEYKTNHQSLKQQYVMIDNQKETVASEKEYMYQQIIVNVNDNIRNWLYEQPEDSGRSTDMFSELMIDSVRDSKKKYEESLADMLTFYQNECSFYGRQLIMIKKKEEIRLFLRIIEDLEEIAVISDEWIAEYLRINGYES